MFLNIPDSFLQLYVMSPGIKIHKPIEQQRCKWSCILCNGSEDCFFYGLWFLWIELTRHQLSPHWKDRSLWHLQLRSNSLLLQSELIRLGDSNIKGKRKHCKINQQIKIYPLENEILLWPYSGLNVGVPTWMGSSGGHTASGNLPTPMTYLRIKWVTWPNKLISDYPVELGSQGLPLLHKL